MKKRWTKSDPELVSLAHLHSGEALDAMGKREQALAEYQALLNRENVFRSHTRVAGREEALPAGQRVKHLLTTLPELGRSTFPASSNRRAC